MADLPGCAAVVIADTRNDRIQVLDALRGESLRAFGSEVLRAPSGVALDEVTGRWIVCDSGNSRVVVFSETGIPMATVGQRGFGPADLLHPTRMAIMDSTDLPEPARKPTVRRAAKQSPAGSASAHGLCIVVSDSGNHRVQVFGLRSE